MAQRKCGYCRQQGHTIQTCALAYETGRDHHNRIIELIEDIDNINNVEIPIQVYFKYISKMELTILSKYHTNFNRFIHNLYTNYQITLSQSAFSTKKDQILILTYFYLMIAEIIEEKKNNIKNKKLKIQTIVIPSQKETTFQCPICIEEIPDIRRITTNCNHDLCDVCTNKYLETLREKDPTCCMCRSSITSLSFTNQECCNTVCNSFL
jgi:hypothetical protein